MTLAVVMKSTIGSNEIGPSPGPQEHIQDFLCLIVFYSFNNLPLFPLPRQTYRGLPTPRASIIFLNLCC